MPNMTCSCLATRASYTRNLKRAQGKTPGEKVPFLPDQPPKITNKFYLTSSCGIDKDNNAEEFISADPTEVKFPENIVRKRKRNEP